MIDIDILGQLVPNPITMVVQLCSTLVLFLLMKKFLWPSVQNYIGKRTEKMQSDIAESEALKKEAEIDRKKANDELQLASKKSEEIIASAVKEAKSEKETILLEANKQAQDELLKAKEKIEKDRLEMVQSMHDEMVDIALSATEKLIGEKSSTEMDKEAIDAFIKEQHHEK